MQRLIWHKITLIIGIQLISAMSVSVPVFAQDKNPPAKTYQPGFFQPIARIDPHKPVTVQIDNQSGQVLHYGLTISKEFQEILAHSKAEPTELALPANLLIYPSSADRVSLKFTVLVKENLITIKVTEQSQDQEGDSALNIKQDGAIYVF